MRNTAVLLINCPDRKGLVAAVASLLYRYGANITHADQHQDHEAGLFFMRVEWTMEGFDLSTFRAEFEITAAELQMQWRLELMSDVPRIAIFVSQHLHCLVDLLQRQQAGELHCSIPLIISNHHNGESLARFYGVEFRHIRVNPDAKQEAEDEQRRCTPFFLAGVHWRSTLSCGIPPWSKTDRRHQPLRYGSTGRRPDHRTGCGANFASGSSGRSHKEGPGYRKVCVVSGRDVAPGAPHSLLWQQNGCLRLAGRRPANRSRVRNVTMCPVFRMCDFRSRQRLLLQHFHDIVTDGLRNFLKPVRNTRRNHDHIALAQVMRLAALYV